MTDTERLTRLEQIVWLLALELMQEADLPHLPRQARDEVRAFAQTIALQHVRGPGEQE